MVVGWSDESRQASEIGTASQDRQEQAAGRRDETVARSSGVFAGWAAWPGRVSSGSVSTQD